MGNSGLQIIKNQNSTIHKEGSVKDTNKKGHFIKFGIFILSILILFGGIFFVKDKFQNIKSTEENLNFQKQKIIEERIAMENAFKSESDKLLKLQLEYENKQRELTEAMNSVKIKEETLNSEILKVEELKNLLVKQLGDIYNLNINRAYGENENSVDKNLNGAGYDDDGVVSSMQKGIVSGISDSENLQNQNEKILSIANADWFIKFDSLGEFNY